MTLRKDSIPFTARRFSSLLLLGVLAATVILLAAACGGGTERPPGETSDTPGVVSDGTGPDGTAGQDAVIKVYSSPT